MKIVGIAACPAGLAHTPMAAKALEKAGAKLGYDFKKWSSKEVWVRSTRLLRKRLKKQLL